MLSESKARAAALGRKGEAYTAAYLRRRGYKIIEKNYRERVGEIDLIAVKKDVIVFVEVKTRSGDALVSGLEAVTYAKQQRVRKTAMMYLQHARCGLSPRFDVAEITVLTDGKRMKRRMNYIENAF